MSFSRSRILVHNLLKLWSGLLSMIAIVVLIQGDLRNLMTWELYSIFLEGHFFLFTKVNQLARRVPQLNNS